MQGNGNGMQTRRLHSAFRRWRSVHLITGFIVALWLFIMAVTGVVINHQEEWGLLEVEIDNGYLPSHYTNEYHPETNSLQLVIADLHSGRFFGASGKYISDFVALLILISICSGTYSHFLRRRLTARPNGEIRPVVTAPPKPPSSESTAAEPRFAPGLQHARK